MVTMLPAVHLDVWTVVKGNDDERASLEAIRHVLDLVEDTDPDLD